MEALFTTEILKYKGEHCFKCDDTLVREIKLEIYINDKKVGALMATPVDEQALALGYLMSENIIAKASDVKSIESKDDGMSVHIKAKIDKKNLAKLNAQGVVISGCGRAHTANIDPDAIEASKIVSKVAFNKDEILTQMRTFYTQCELYEKTGCVHTAKLFVDEKTFFIGEDIAQHNTIDKALGKAHLAGVSLDQCFLMVSGRLSSEMVAKAIMHKIPVLVSRTAPTCLGVMIARKFDLTLCGFAREDKINIYSGGFRIYG
ncbi:formate dehydrogenase accessory sulfurtransferase FdhD [Campylobacter sp. VicNov18]|uniref:formate dehydrogenase accessory sulfurtransferase FdhD n=1 Tax=Campylobacter bilis TaxID=2691918 RepID=UPI00130EC958|nr:formate dehydrogenase accessory sulfurtransferase FdhD [Campylobacter bilis]MPV63934.1 formate dehydrogenase accessory sulfurtransferase FdhD [Campylobacter hepaticus]MBM0637435.1 formate dehydrogenase accessory sulfurtransferase FdhD [Campylobacter bilis]MCC8278154.1 formate dehydrogenase accessory sulfurtransferase FdhD [Campylobacter bilis]MCC8299658.1 formate dehydrogenase accessory sulfurtransferase FdhD [Campylobacter bilis]MCC8301063.1 formate dehydrogenase accessory sulfurtransferas